MSRAEPVIEARALRKRYGSFEAVRGIDFTVERGQCFGFLGPNGAGKSTTMRMLYRATPVGAGALRILGHDATTGAEDRAIKRRLGVVPQDINLDERLSARENLRIFARFYGLRGRAADARVAELLAFAELEERAEAPVETLSGGLKRRVQIARGLLGKPAILVLDEPTTGLDPQVRNALWERLARLKHEHTTLVLTTHYMDEAEKLCDQLVIMDRGLVVASGTPEALIAAHVPGFAVELRAAEHARIAALERELGPRAQTAGRLADRLLLFTDDGEGLLRHVLGEHPDVVATLRRSTLEDVFVRITGHGLGAD
ncbi:ABC transporter ATP-binding protein [Haliangium ochraceum]|uniref:ABC transporter related protein n=1 Tax=Haliangium ochraceum (strain DSM 14365 / JCM 11303 / SMP-2) TaxID=502025 RepID=D0LJQ2_HALO1|nr:ABC transporter ATP-binding protein [Haliangium ochraceum]ACY16626.1 ABC transporter related protein [Haliangium ochraceum DSM 14365]